MVVTGTHDPYLVVLSILVACFASYTALDLGGRVGAARGLARRVWLGAAAITMGSGIWSMHFVGMLAFTMPIPMSYEVGLTALSLVVAILVTSIGFYVITSPGASSLHLVLSGIFMGLGIVAMHFTGMAAMQVPAELTYDRRFVALSVVIAIGASTAALWLAFRTKDIGQNLVAALVMGLAISGMHYTAMRAAVFLAPRPFLQASEHASLHHVNLALVVAAANFVMLAAALIASRYEEQHAEEALRQAQAELAHVTRVTTLGEVTASFAHEVNQPLAAIVNNANACLGLLPSGPQDLDEVRDALCDIVSDAERASAIIQRVRAMATRSPSEKVPLRLEDVVEDVVALAATESAARRVSIRTEVAADLPVVSGDRVELQQVLLNLVVNGMDAMGAVHEQGRLLEIRGRPEVQDGSLAAMISVQDHGIGFNAVQVGRLFEAFYTTKPHGMGMGLAISRSIIEMHGGRLWAEANRGQGATFSFSVPAAVLIVRNHD
jgi:NO-binding membrane sensor protein with MHYT domain